MVFALIDSSKDVVFSSALPSTSYEIFLFASLQTTFTISNKATTGFTVTVGTAIDGSVSYAAIMDT